MTSAAAAPTPEPAGAHLPRSFRVDPDLWERALGAARRRGTTRSAVLTKALEELVTADQLEREWITGLGGGQEAGQ